VSVFIAILGLGLLIVVHEAGHFLTALAVGMRPRSFNLGFGPPLAKTTRKDVEYAVRAVPLGGYVKIPGMHRPAPADVDAYFGAALRETPELVGPTRRLKRALDAGDEQAAREALAEVEQVGPADAPGLERGVREISDALSPFAYWRQRTWRRVAVIAAGPGTNFLLAIVLFAVVFAVAGGKATSTVAEVLPDHPAQALGLKPGDQVVAIDSQRVTPGGIVRVISSSGGRPLTVTVIRHGRVLQLGPVRPRKEGGVYRLGFRLGGAHLGVGESLWASLKLSGVVTRETVKSLGRIVHRQGRKQLSSPVGIVRQSAAEARQGWQDYLLVLGFISLSLALLNLLPLLPLDGGHIAFSLIEGVRGRAVTREVYERVSAIGIAVVLLLFFVGLSNDLGRLGGG
jgi:regulator of sigma E protease